MNQTLPFLQSEAWGDFQRALGKTVFLEKGDGWSYLAILEKGTLNTRLYCPYGPYITKKEAISPALASLQKLGKRLHVTYLRVEPTGEITADQLQQHGLRKVSYIHLQPEHTQIIDLSHSEEDIIANMSQSVRNVYRNYSKKGIAIHSSTDPQDISILLPFIRSTAERNKISLQGNEYLRKQAKTLMSSASAKLFYATLDNQPIAAALVYDSKTTRYYAHAGADNSYRKLQAGTVLVAHMIIDAKHSGLQTFDLMGITLSEDPQHPWAGFTKFKKSFGGESYSYVGLWELPLRPFQYALYRLLQKIR